MRIAIVRAIYGSTPHIITDVVRHPSCTASDETLRKTPVVAAVCSLVWSELFTLRNRTVFKTLLFSHEKKTCLYIRDLIVL